MKMLEIFYIVILFNFVLALFGSIGISIASDYNPLTPELLGWILVPAFTGALVLAAASAYFFPRATNGVVYGFIGGTFWGSWGYSISVFTSISAGLPELVAIIAIFTAIVGVVFIVGISQMVVGGFKANE